MGIISHVIFFFMSYALGEELLNREVTMLETGRKNKPELPSELLAVKNMNVPFSVFAFTEKATLVSYCSKTGKNLLLHTTIHKDAALSTREDKKTQMVLDYETKGGVDSECIQCICYIWYEI